MAALRVVFFDLGLTLIDERRSPFPHASEAVRAIQSLPTASGGVLATALVSDFDLVPPPPTPKKVRPVFARYVELLDATGLRPLFEPVMRHVTLSTHAGVEKPSPKVFEVALRRLRFKASLTDCLLITENADHIASVRAQLGMQGLLFGRSADAEPAFDDWREAPALVAGLLDPSASAEFEHSLERHGQVGPAPRGVLGDQTTHERDFDATGRPRLVRKRFRAF